MVLSGKLSLLVTPIFGLLMFFTYINVAQAANACVSSGTGNWNVPGNWTSCGGTFPGAGDSVTIASGHTLTVNVDSTASSVIVNNGALATNLTISSGKTLNVSGAVTIANPTANTITTSLGVGGGNLNAGSIALSGAGTNRISQLTMSTGTITVTGNVSFSGTAANARVIFNDNGTLNVAGNFGSGGTLTTAGGFGTINFNGGAAQTIGTYTTYNNVQINNTSGGVTLLATNTTFGGTLLVNAGTLDIGGFNFTVNGATTINSTLRISSTAGTKTFGDITVASGGTLNFTAAEVITHLGNLTVNGTGTITGTTGVWAFQKVGGGTISGTASSVAITSATFTTSYVSSIPSSYSGTVTVTGAAVVLTNNSTLTVTTSLAGTGQFTQGTSSVLNLGGTSTITTFDASASTNEVHFTSTAANQTIHSSTYHHLFIDKSGRTGTLGGATTVNGNLTVTAGNLADGGFQITGNGTGTLTLPAGSTLTLGTTASATGFPTSFTNAHSVLNATSTVNYNSNVAQTISNVPSYGNLTTTATSAVTKTAAGAITVNGTFTNGNNNTFADSGFTITLKASVVMTGPHTGTGNILFSGGSAAHSVSGAGSYSNVELDDSFGVTQSATTNIGGSFTITTGTWTVGAFTIAVTGDTSVSSILAITSTTGTKTFGNITINTGGAISFSAAEAMTINGNVTVNGTGVISGTSGVWTFQKVGGGTIGGTVSVLTILGSTTFATQYLINVPFMVNTFTVNSSINESNTGTITVNTSLAGAGTFTQSAGSVLNLGGTANITTLDASINSNEVHYTSTAANQTIKTTSYYNLFIDKAGRLGTVGGGTTNVLGNLTLSAGTLDVFSSTFIVTGITSIHGSFRDLNNTGSTTFGGVVTVFPGGSWDCVSSEDAPFNFSNGLVFNGGSFVAGPGLYTFQNNNQSITGVSAVTIDKIVVTGIQLTQSNTAPLTVSTSLSGTGEFIQDTNTILDIAGTSAINTLTASASGNTVNYNGTATQTVHAGTYQTLNVNSNTNGSVNILADTTANTALTLGATIFSTSANKMIMGSAAILSRTTGFINGNLQKNISIGSSSQTFEIGSGIDYTPVDLTFNAVTVAGDVLVNTTPNDHASLATSDLIASQTVNRFYTVINSGVSFSTYDATFSFAPTDMDPGTTVVNFVVEKLDSGTWSRLTRGGITDTSVSATGMTSFSDFQIGEAQVTTTTSSNPSPNSGGEDVTDTIRPVIQILKNSLASIPQLPDTGPVFRLVNPVRRLPDTAPVGPALGNAENAEDVNLFDITSEPVQSAQSVPILFLVFSIITGLLLIVLVLFVIRRTRYHMKLLNTTLVILLLLTGCIPATLYAASQVQTAGAGLVSKVAPGELLPFSIKLSNFGNRNRVDVTVSYKIADTNGKEIYSSEETVAVETTASFVKTIQIPFETVPGRYIAKSSIIYQDQVTPATTEFPFVVERKVFGLFQSDFLLYGGSTLVISLVMLALGRILIKRRQSSRFTPLDYSDVPKDQRVFYELISDTVMGMRQRVGDKALDIAKQTTGLVIDETTGRVVKLTDTPSKVIAQLVSGYEKVLGQKVSFSLRRGQDK